MANGNNHITISQKYLDGLEEGLTLQKGKDSTFGQRNFIIGPNGGGKTRLLRAVKKYYEDRNHTVIFANFPELVGKVSDKNQNREESIFDILVHQHTPEEAAVLATIEADISEFIKELSVYTPGAANRNKRVKTAINELNAMLGKFLNIVWLIPLADISQKGKTEYDRGSLADYYERMSPGERNLLYVSVFLSNFAISRKDKPGIFENLVILIDEPELHLHYDMIRRFIDTVEEIFNNTPVWVASHSVHLLTRYKFSEITYVAEGEIIRETGGLREKIVDAVLGPEEFSRELLLDVESWEYLDFVRQCFEGAETIGVKESGTDDPQFQEFLKILEQKIKTDKPVRILDYGAGQGRFGVLLKNIMVENGWKDSQLEYYTFYLDKEAENVFGEKFDFGMDLAQIQNNHNTFDVVLLVNTLHEIVINEWGKVFQTIKDSLVADGYLFFCEAQVLANGERLLTEGKPVEHGYLVLCKPALDMLFKVEAVEKERIVHAQISKKQIESRRYDLFNVVRILKDHALEKAKGLATPKGEGKEEIRGNARKRAFYSMQYINAEIAIDMLKLEMGSVIKTKEIGGDGDGGRTVKRRMMDAFFEMESVIKFKVIGVGGGGGRIVNRMIDASIDGVEYIAIDSDSNDLSASKASFKLHIGKMLTDGAGGSPLNGTLAAEESREEIASAIRNADIVFIAACMGGGTGTGAAPIIAEIAREMGILTLGIITKPFSFEDNLHINLANHGVAALKDNADALLVISNEFLKLISKQEVALENSFFAAAAVVKQFVQCISNLISIPGLVNLDFADVTAIMKGAGNIHIGVGRASGKDKAQLAVMQAISSPFLETSIKGAKGVIMHITASDDIDLDDIDAAVTMIKGQDSPNVKVIWGASLDSELQDEMFVTIIATEFEGTDKKSSHVARINKHYDSEVNGVDSISEATFDDLDYDDQDLYDIFIDNKKK